jgi:plasmid stabilization system protein ParE
MPADLLLAPEAVMDLADAYSWYEERRSGLGEEFLTCVEATLESICRSPVMYSIVNADYRRALVRRFPYAIFFEGAQDTVTVYAILHAARNPEKWKQRLPL